jgi:pimeloyl-ACP methyl ester carboxylesterase
VALPEVRRAAGLSYRESGRRDAPALVLLHGIGSTSAGWRDQYASLGERFRVVGWSAPGYHDSAPLPGEAPAASDYAAALARLLDALSVDDAALVTNSWGTLVALAFATVYPKRVRALVLGGPTVGSHGLSPVQRAERAAERIARVRGLGLQAMRVQDAPRLVSGTAPQPVVQWVIHGIAGEAPTADGYCQAARMLYDTDGVELIRSLAHPVLVISGTEDVITPPERNARLLAAAARSARFAAIEACGHLPHLEKPAAFNGLVSDFLAAK